MQGHYTGQPVARQADLAGRDPFRQTVLDRAVVAELSGALPSFLSGALIRTAPYKFVSGDFAAAHWFDGLALFYAFHLGGSAPRFVARSLDCDFARAIADDTSRTPAMFGTPMRRPFLARLFSPIPRVTDNTNVHVVRMGPDLVAMTEGPTHLVLDEGSLGTRGPVVYHDDFSCNAMMLAHPQLDPERRVVVGLASELGPTSTLTVYEHAPASRTRRPVVSWRCKRVPYVHSFGLSRRHAVLVDHPMRFSPLRMLWSNDGFAGHLRWDGGPTRLVVLPRDGSAARTAETQTMFVFHVVNAHDDGDDVVMDVCAHDDGSIVDALSIRSLLAPGGLVATKGEPGASRLGARLLRLRIGRDGVGVDELGEHRMEFPAIAQGRAGREPGVIWGSTAFADADGRSYVLRVDVRAGGTRRFDDPGHVLGEPVFVRDPSRGDEEGVLLVVGTHAKSETTCLFVLDATTLEPVARVVVDGLVPMGFHGSFVRTGE